MARDASREVRRATTEMDRGLTDVMPEDWAGHGRLAIRDRRLDPSDEQLAEDVFEKLHEKHPEKNARKLARVAVKKVREK